MHLDYTKLFTRATVVGLLLCISQPALATTYTWTGATNSDFNNSTNWNPAIVPGASDTAVLPNGPVNKSLLLNTISQSISTITVNDVGYSLTCNPGTVLSILGLGINGTNSFTIFNDDTTIFRGISNAAPSITIVNTINNSGALTFTDTSSAGYANIVQNGPTTTFIGNATAANSTITASGGAIFFLQNSTAANATISMTGGAIDMKDSSNAGNASLTLTNANMLFNNASSAPNATIVNNGGVTVLTDSNVSIGSLSGSGDISLSSRTLTLGGLNQNDTITGAINDSGGITKIGTGSLSLLGANNYTGTTSVLGGDLHMGNLTKSANVASGSTLFVNNFTPGAGSQLRIGASPGGTSGLLNATATATLTGSNLRVDFATGAYPSATVYTLIQAATVTGTFANVSSSSALLAPQLTYNAASVTMQVQNLPIKSVLTNLNANKGSTATELDRIFNLPAQNPDWDVIHGVLNQLGRADLTDAVGKITPDQHNNSTKTTTHTTTKSVSDVLSGRGKAFIANAKGRSLGKKGVPSRPTRFAGDPNSGNPFYKLMQVDMRGDKQNFIDNILASPEVHFDDMKRLSAADQMSLNENRGSPWFQPFGSISDLDTTPHATGYTSKTGGILVGFDKNINDNLLVGISGGYARTHLKYDASAGSINVRNIIASLYTTVIKDSLHTDMSVTGSLNHFDEFRNIVFDQINRAASDTHRGYSINAHLGLTYDFSIAKDTTLSPFVNLDYGYDRENGYTETGADALNLTVRSKYTTKLQSEAGLQLSKSMAIKDGTFNPSFSLSYVNVKPIKKDSLVASFVGESGIFVNVGTNKNRNYGAATVNTTFNYNSGTRLSLAYTGNANRHYKAHQVSVTYGINL